MTVVTISQIACDCTPCFNHTVTTASTTSGATPVRTAQASGCDGPMEPGDFAAARKTVAGNNFEDGKLSSARTIVGSNCLSVNQIMDICRTFGYEETKLTFAKFAYKYC